MKWIDLPPLWLAGHIALVWILAPRLPFRITAPWVSNVGAALIVLGLLLMLIAVVTMWRARTTPIPHREANRLVDFGIFAYSRNPIYLGDALILSGVVLRAGPLPLWLLVLFFLTVIERRFIVPEEERLQRQFGAKFEAYCALTRRWI